MLFLEYGNPTFTTVLVLVDKTGIGAHQLVPTRAFARARYRVSHAAVVLAAGRAPDDLVR